MTGFSHQLSRKKPHRKQGNKSVTLARALSKLSIASRSQARSIVEDGRVKINGVVERNPDKWIDLTTDRVAVDGIVAKKKQFVYLAMHKPAGYVTTRSDERGRKTVYDLLDEEHHSLFPIGRLDKETSGLLLFTNDTQFGERITNPDSKMEKAYEVTLDRGLQTVDADLMRKGMSLDGVDLLPAKVFMKKNPMSVEITISEGKNRQIRRMFEALGYRVESLHRKSVGDVVLGNLPEGKTRTLTQGEIKALSHGQ